GRMRAAVEAVEVLQLLDTGEVADAAIDYEARLGPGGNSCSEVVADKGAVLDLAEEVHTQHIAFAERVDDPGVLAAGPLLRLADRLDRAVQVRASRDVPDGHRATDQDPVGVHVDPVALEVEVVVMTALDDAPGLVVGDELHSLEDVIR